MKAAKLCLTSFYLCCAILVGYFFLGALGALAAAIASMATAVVGLAQLRRLGPAPDDLSSIPPAERVAVKLAHRARPMAVTAVTLSVVALLIVGFLFKVAADQARRKQVALDEFTRKLDRISDEWARQQEEAAPGREAQAVASALERVGIDARGLVEWRRAEGSVIFALPVTSDESIDFWNRVRSRIHDFGRYPVIVYDPDGAYLDQLEDDEPQPTRVLEAARSVNAVAWIRKRADGDPEYYGSAELGEWKDGQVQEDFSIPYDHEGNPVSGLKLVLVPTTESWEAIAWLGFGGWNECPAPEAHVAVQKYWNEKYGAELICVSNDAIEMSVSRPPRDRDSVMELAREQFVYSGGDLVFQGFGSLRPLASSLVGAHAWFFWWD